MTLPQSPPQARAPFPVREARRRESDGPKPYDFRRPTKLSREHVRTLQIACETFAHHYTSALTTALRTVAQVSLITVEQLTYDEYISALETPTMLAMATIEPLPGVLVHEFSLSAAMTWIDLLLGGTGAGTQPQRPLSDMESPLVADILARVLGELRYSFDVLGPIQPKLSSLEYNPQFVQACGASDTVVVASFDMKVAGEECVSTICLPFAAIAQRLELATGKGSLTPQQRAAREAAAKAMTVNLEAVPVDVSVRLTPTDMQPAELLDLRIGDVLPMPHRTSAPLFVTAADVTFAYAVPGQQGSRLACLVVEPPKG